jgi:hypothetical protein
MTMTLRQISLLAIVGFLLGSCEADTSPDTAPAPDESASDALGSGLNGGNPDVSAANPELDTISIPVPDAVHNVADVVAEEDAGPSLADVMVDVTLPPWVVGDGACTDPSDLAVLENFDPMADMMSVGMACFGAPGGTPGETDSEEVYACFVAALTSDYGFSEGCGGCVADHMLCVQEMCMNECMGGSMGADPSPECLTCIETSGCKAEFTDCTGIDPDLFEM